MNKKTVIGALVMAVAVLVSIPLGVNRSFSRLREDVQSEYYFDNTEYSIYDGIDARIAAARNMVTLAKRYADQDPGLDPYVDNVEYLAELCENYWFEDIEDIEQEVSYNQRLGQAVQELADRLETVELKDSDQKYPRQLLADMESEQDKIERSSFNDEVLRYNRRLTEFPANLLGDIAGVKPITPFGHGSGDASTDRSSEVVTETREGS